MVDVIVRARTDNVGEYLTTLARDYEILHPGVRLEIRGDLPKRRATIQHGSLYVLAVCELIDNAIGSVGTGGVVAVDSRYSRLQGCFTPR
jgi:hypothetical protein